MKVLRAATYSDIPLSSPPPAAPSACVGSFCNDMNLLECHYSLRSSMPAKHSSTKTSSGRTGNVEANASPTPRARAGRSFWRSHGDNTDELIKTPESSSSPQPQR